MPSKKIQKQHKSTRRNPQRLLEGALLASMICVMGFLVIVETVQFYQSIDFYKLSLGLTAALMIGVASISFARFAAKPNNTVLFIGLAFSSHAFLDILQLFIISDYWTRIFTINQYAVIYWSWLTAQVLWAVLLLIAAGVSYLRHRYGEKAEVRGSIISVFTIVLTISAALFFLFLD